MDKAQQRICLDEFTRGSEKAFDCLFNEYKKAIRGYILAHCFGQLKQRADDIAQETWYIIWEKREQFDTSRSFYSFVCYWAGIMIKRQLNNLSEEISLDDENLNEEIMLSGDNFFSSSLNNKIEDLFKVTFSIGGPPHQLIAFGFNKLLSQWNPRTIVKELSSLSLGELLHILIHDYIAASHMPEELVNSLFRPLAFQMTKLVNDALDDEVSRNAYKELLFVQVQDTLLKQYFGQDPVHNISDWTYKVRSRVSRYYMKLYPRTHEKIYLKSVS